MDKETFSQVLVSDDDEEDESDPKMLDHVINPDKNFDEDTFGMAVCSIIRDCHSLSTMEADTPQSRKYARGVRMFSTLILLAFTLFLQIFLLVQVKHFVSAKAVHDVRQAYSVYQEHVYQCTTDNASATFTHCYKTKYGSWRGKKEFFNVTLAIKRLNSMPEDDQGNACRISLSQPAFLYFILFIWTITCLNEIRKAVELQGDFCSLQTVSSMAESMEMEDGEDADGDHVTSGGRIVGATCPLKLMVSLLLILRIGITLVLLYLGSRWLLATNRFADLILNAMALEFVLVLKELMYAALMPNRNKIDLQNTTIAPSIKKIDPGLCSFANSFILIIVTAVWVWLYMVYIQEVLPGYNWDVHEVCSDYIKERFCVSTDCITSKGRRLLRGSD